MNIVPVFGEVPPLVGEPIEALVAEAFVCAGDLVSSANVLFIRSRGRWHRLSVDAGTVHWKRENGEPQPWSVAEHSWLYPHHSLTEELGLGEATLSSLSIQGEGSAVRLELAFSNGRRLVLFNGNDRSSYHVA